VVDLAKGFERRKCNHREAIPGDACLKDVIGNFVVPALLRKLSLSLSRRNEQTPLRRCYTVTAPTFVTTRHPCRTYRSYQSFGDDSRTTQRCDSESQGKSESNVSGPQFLLLIAFLKVDEAALRPSESELAKLPASVQQTEPPKMRKRGPKGPNPLSVKKKKPTVPQPTQPKPKSKSIPTGSKRKLDDEPDDVQASAENDQDPGGGHKRKRRRKAKSELSADHDAS